MKCISCDSPSLDAYSESSYMNLPVYHCKICGLYVSGDSEEKMKEKSEEIYKKEYWEKRGAETSLKSDFTDVDSQGKKRRWNSQYAYCKPYFDNKKDFLEIGAGAGQSIIWFEEIGFNVSGIEPDANNVKLINQKLKRGRCIAGFAEDLPINEKFDIIWISHVFEHLVRPDLLLEKCKKSLREEGILFIEVPNCENEETLHSSIYDNPSTFHFSKNALTNISRKSGLNLIRCDYFRSPTKLEGGINKIIKKIPFLVKYNPYPYYPKVITDNKNGTDIRIILKN